MGDYWNGNFSRYRIILERTRKNENIKEKKEEGGGAGRREEKQEDKKREILASERNNASRKGGKDNKEKEDFGLVPSQNTEHLPKPELYSHYQL